MKDSESQQDIVFLVNEDGERVVHINTEAGFDRFTGLVRRDEVFHLVIGEGIKKLPYAMFIDHTELASVRFPDSLEDMNYNTFRRCTGLTSLNLPGGLKDLGVASFEGCVGLTSITFRGSLEKTNSFAFQGCKGLISVTFPLGLKVIGDGAFNYCKNLTAPILPASLQSIGYCAFRACQALNSLILPEGLLNIDFNAFKDSGLTYIAFPDSLTTVGNNILIGCKELKGITLPGNNELAEKIWKSIPEVAQKACVETFLQRQARQSFLTLLLCGQRDNSQHAGCFDPVGACLGNFYGLEKRSIAAFSMPNQKQIDAVISAGEPWKLFQRSAVAQVVQAAEDVEIKVEEDDHEHSDDDSAPVEGAAAGAVTFSMM